MKENKLFPNILRLCFFGRTSGIDISLNIFQAIKEAGLPLGKLFNISSDGPNLKMTLWREINDTLKKKIFQD